jgi:hypothetical protein
MESLMEWWNSTPIDAARVYRSRIGPLEIWIRRLSDEWQVAWQYPGTGREMASPLEPGEAPEGVDWSRWVAGDEASAIRLVPTLPDRPLVARPDAPFRIPPHREALLYLGVPVWMKVVAGKAPQAVPLREIPTVMLSNTWFGDPFTGELCYSLTTRARRSVEPDPQPHRAVCPVRVHNAADVELDMERLCVRVPHLRLHAGSDRLWANEMRVRYKGPEKVAEIHFDGGPPAVEGVGPMVGEPRVPPEKHIVKRTFSHFRSWMSG